MPNPARTQTTRLKYAQLVSTGYRLDLIPPDHPFIDSQELERRHEVLCTKLKISWPIENLRKFINSGRIRLGLFTKSDKIIGIGYYSEIIDVCTLEQGMFVYGLQLDPAAKALVFAECVSHELAAMFDYAFVRFASTRKGWGAPGRNNWSFSHSVWEHQYGRRWYT